MKMVTLFATIYFVFIPASLSILVPQPSVIDWTSRKYNDRLNAHPTVQSREQNETDFWNTVDHKPSLNSKNSNDSGKNNEAFQYVRLYYLIRPYPIGNFSKWQKSNYDGEAVGNAHDKGINGYENATKGGVSDESTYIRNKKVNYPQRYVMHVPSHKKKNATNGASNKKNYSDIAKETSGLLDDSIFFQPYPVGNISKWQESNYDEEAVGNAHYKGILRYENVAKDVISDENINTLNKKANNPQWYVIHVPSHKKKNATNGASNKKNYSDIAKETSGPTDDSHVKGDIGNSEGKHLGTVEIKGKDANVSELYKMYLKIFHFSNKQNLKLNSESVKNNEIPIFLSLSAESFNGGGKNGEFNKDSKTSSETAFTLNNGYIFDSNVKSQEATGEVALPDEKEHKTNYNRYFFRHYFGEYPENMTTENTYGLKYEASRETGERNGQFQMNTTRESRSRKEGTHTAYFISNHADKQASFSRQKRQVKTNKESEGREHGNGNLDDIRSAGPISNTSKGSGTTIEKSSNNSSAVDGDLVKKLQNSSLIRGKVPTEDTENKFSKGNSTQLFHPNPMTSDKVNSSTTVAKSPNAFPKPDSNNQSSFHPTQSKGNPKEAMNLKVGNQKDIKSMAEGKNISESVSGSTKMAGETSVGIAGNHSILEEKISTVKYSEIKNVRDKTRNQNGTTTKPIQMVINGSSDDTHIVRKTFSNNTSDNSVRNERSLGKYPFLRIDFKADMGAKEQTINKTCPFANETVKPEEVSHTDNLSIAEEKKGQEVMYRSHEKDVNATLKDETRAFNISKEDTPDKEKQVPLKQTMSEVTETANVTTQEPVIYTGVKNTEEATQRESDSHKFNDGTQTTTSKTEVLNENVTAQKTLIPLQHTDSTPLAEVKSIEAVAYRNNDDRKSLETITDETQVANRNSSGEVKESNPATSNDNVEINSTGSHLMKEIALNVTTEQSQAYENTTTSEIMNEAETHSGPMDDPPHINRPNASDTTKHGMKRESFFSPKQLIGTNDNSNPKTKLANHGMLDDDKRNATGDNLNETDGTKIKSQHIVPEQMQTFTDNSNFERVIFARKDVFGLTTKDPNASVTTESVINNQQENTPTKQMQTVNSITNMTGWFERKQRNVEKETNETETAHPSILDKTKDDLLNDKPAVSSNSKDATNFEIQPRITAMHSGNILQNIEKSANKTYEANPTASANRSNFGEAKESNQATLNDNVERNSAGNHLMKEIALNVTATEQPQTYENITTTEIMTETETLSGPMDDPSHINRQNASDTSNHGMKHETLFSPKQLVGTGNSGDHVVTETNTFPLAHRKETVVAEFPASVLNITYG